MTLLAPNGKPSNLTPEQYRLVRTPAFKKWFGDWEKLAFAKLRDSAMDDITLNNLSKDVSKVVDENGEPLVVWHGSKNEFNIFDTEKAGSNMKNVGEKEAKMFFFSSNKETSQSPLYVNYKINSDEFNDFTKYIAKQFHENMENLAKLIGVSKEEAIKGYYEGFVVEDLKDAGSIENLIEREVKEKRQKTDYPKSDYQIATEIAGYATFAYHRLWNYVDKYIPETDESFKRVNDILNVDVTPKIIFKKIKSLPLEEFSNVRPFFLNIKDILVNTKHDIDETLQEIAMMSTEHYNGSVTKNVYDGGLFPTDIYTITNPNNIKLADGTNTTFDGTNPDIRFMSGGGVSTIDQYTSQSIKKAYVSIRIKYESGRAENDKFFNKYEIKSFDEKTFEELKDHKLKGILGVSTSNYNLSEWLVHRECLVVMPFDKFKELNKTEQVQYYDADYLSKNGFDALHRLFDRKGRTDDDYGSVLQNIFPKITQELHLEGMSMNQGSEYANIYVIADWFNIYNSSKFISYVVKQKRINSPEELAQIVIDYANSEQSKIDYYYNRQTENISIESIIQPIIRGIVKSGSIYVDESEWLIKNKELIIPENSQLFFVIKDYENMRSKYDEMISKYDLKSSYKIAFINQKNLNELQTKRWNLKSERSKEEWEKAKTFTQKRIVNSIQKIQNDVIEEWTSKLIEEFKESYSNEVFKDYDGNSYSDNILEVPSAITYFDSLMLKFIDIYDSKLDYIVKTKSKYAFADIFNEFSNYIDGLKSKEGEEELEVRTSYNRVYKYDILQKLYYYTRNADYEKFGKQIKSEIGADLYRYFSKGEINFKNGGQPKQSKMKKQLLCPVGTEVQTLIFSKDNFTEKSAKDWAKKHDFNYGYVDKKENTFRIRQQEPSDFKNMRTIEMTKGLKAVIGCPKKKYLDGGDVYAEGGNVRTLLNRFDKEKPQISLYVIADDVADSLLFDDYKQKGIDNAWATLKDEQKEKYNQDYRVFKEQLYKYMIYNFVRLYYSDAKVREKCKGQSRLTISRIKMFLNNIGGQYDKAKYPSVQKDSKEEILNLIEVLQPLAESGNEEALNLIEILKDTISGQKFNDGGEIWKLTKEEYAKDTITVHSGDNLKRKKTDLESYFENNITNRLHAYAVKKAIQEGKYEDAIRNGIMTRERANEIISGIKLDDGGGIDNADFDIKNIIEKTGFSEGLKQMLVNDFSESGYSNVEMLFANTPKNLPLNQKIWATSKNIQQKINGFSSGKNTYLQANKIAEIMYSVLASVPEVEQQPIIESVIEEQPVITTTEYKYNLRSRPFGIGTYPYNSGFVRFEEDGSKFGCVVYSAPLTIETMEQYELVPITDVIKYDGADMLWNDNYDAKISVLKNDRGTYFVKIIINGKENKPITKSAIDFLKDIDSGKYKFKETSTEPAIPENKKQDIEDLIEVLQSLADEGNQEAIELISTLRDVLDAEFPQMKHGGQTEFLHSGKADKLTLKQIAKKHNVDLSVIERQFNLGMGIESEHTNDKKLQAEIVKDHLTEYSNYYTALIKMESYLDKQKAEEGIIIDNEDGFYIDLDDSIDSNNFLIVLMMDGIRYVEVSSNNPLKRRIEFNSERDFDKAIISLNKFIKQENEEKSNFQPPQNLNQLKKILNKGFKLKIVYHRARPTEVGNIRQVEIKQNNAVAYKDLSKPESDLIWFYFPKPQDLEFGEKGFNVYYSGEPSKKMVSYEYFFDERDEKSPKKELTEREMQEKMIEYLRLLGD